MRACVLLSLCCARSQTRRADQVKRVLCDGDGARQLLALAVRHADEKPTRATDMQWRLLRDRAADVIERCVHVKSSSTSSASLAVDVARTLNRFAPPLAVDGDAAATDAAGVALPRLRRYARRVLCVALARAALVDDAVCGALADAGALRLLADAER